MKKFQLIVKKLFTIVKNYVIIISRLIELY